MWQNYCKIRGAVSYENVNKLIVTDKLFNTLKEETTTHIGLTEQNNWLEEAKINKEYNNYFDVKHKSYRVTYKSFKGEEKYVINAKSLPRENSKFSGNWRQNKR